MSDLPAYSGDDETVCVKCAHLTEPETQYEAQVRDGLGRPVIECLVRRCRHCGYEWREATASATE